MKVDVELVFRQPLLEVEENAVLRFVALEHLGLVQADVGLEIVLGIPERYFRPIEQVEDGRVVVGNAHAEYGLEAYGRRELAHDSAQAIVEVRHAIGVVRSNEAEIILAEITRDAGRHPLGNTQFLPHALEERIADVAAVPIVEQGEMVDVDGDEAPLARIDLIEPPLRLDEKRLLPQKVRPVVAVQFALAGTRINPFGHAILLRLDVERVQANDPRLKPVRPISNEAKLHPTP